MAGFQTPPPDPFNYPWTYNPARSMGFDPNGMGGALAPLFTQYLQQFAGPTNFLPHQNPAQNAMDQLTMRQYFNSAQLNTASATRAGTGHFANVIGGGMMLATNQPLSDLNKQQANFMAGIANNQYVKAAIGGLVGPENLEAMMFGTKGDPSALAGAANRVGYYRQDPATGASRIRGESLADFTNDVYATLYEPGGNLEETTRQAREGKDDVKAQAITRLKKAARAEHERVIEDDEIATRMTSNLGAEELGSLYKKYRAGGEATTAADQAKELVKIERAVRDSGVMGFDETSVGALRGRAERAAVENMHGFSAGRAGQVMEHLFQRGMLPQSIGALSAADRVKAIAASEDLDDETKTRLARQFAERDLGANDKEYKAATPERREEIIAGRLDDYKRRVGDTMTKIKERSAAGTVDPEEARKLLTMDGMDQIASNVDAKRAGQSVKKHTEALAAVREIFGDNGNTNAPIPALLAALEHLSQGASGRSGNTTKVASTLRQMRIMAKEIGMGFDQMAQVAAGVNAYGSQLGLSDEEKLNATSNAIATVRNMDRAGAFNNRGFGTMSKEEATTYAAEVSARTENSFTAKSAAAIRRAYLENKDKYENTELGIIGKKMEDPNWDGSYEVEEGGKKVTRNFWNDVGRNGAEAISRISGASGMDMMRMNILMEDYQTREFAASGGGMKAIRADMTRMISNTGVADVITKGIKGDATSALGGDSAKDDEVRDALAQRMTNLMLDSAHMSSADQLQHLEDTTVAEFTATLEGMGVANAADEAKKAFEASFGADAKTRRENLSNLVTNANIGIFNMTGGRQKGLRGMQQFFKGVDSLSETQAATLGQADRAHRLGLSYQGTSIERLSDSLGNLVATGETADIKNILFDTFGITPDSELIKKIAPELQGEFNRALTQINRSTVTKDYIHKLERGEATDYAGNKITGKRVDEEMYKLATRGMTEDQRKQFDEAFKTKVTDEQIAARRNEKFDKMVADAEAAATKDPTKLKETDLYKTYAAAHKGKIKDGITIKEMADEMRTVHLGAGSTVEGFQAHQLIHKGEFTGAQLRAAVEHGSLNQARLDSTQWASEHERGTARFIGLFGGDEAETRQGLRAALLSDADAGGYNLDGAMAGLMEHGMVSPDDDSPEAKKHRDEFEKILAGLSLTDKHKERIRGTFSGYQLAEKIELAQQVRPSVPGEAPTTAPALPTQTAAQMGHAPGAPAVPEIKPSPGGAEAAKELAEGSSKDPAQAAAAQKEADAKSAGARAGEDVAVTAPSTPAPGRPATPDISPQPDGSQPGTSVVDRFGPALDIPDRLGQAAEPGPATEEGTEKKSTQSQRDNAALTSELGKLTEAIKGLERPFRDLIDAVGSKKGGGSGSVARDDDKSDRRQLAMENRTNLQNVMFHQKGSSAAGGGGSGGGSSTIKGTLTLVGLQSAILAAKGAPVFTPTGEGPAIVSAMPNGAYLSSAAVSPVAEA
ncbi:hypothetical protein EBZ39_00255 [bacterium]|nr:hypothetical protein [bacterium]